MVRRKLDERDSINSRLSHSLPNGLHRICDSLIQLVYKSPPPTHTHKRVKYGGKILAFLY